MNAIMTPRRLLACAAILHIALAAALFAAGRAALAPALIDRDGIVTAVAPDSRAYQRLAAPPTEALQRGDVVSWARAAAPPHVRLMAISFAALAPLAGYSPLAAEPFNLLCYLAVVALVLAIGRAAGGDRAGTIAAAIAAVWPTLLVHTLQLLKDPLFVAGALALVYVALTWLTSTYDGPRAVRLGALLSIASALAIVVRPPFLLFVLPLVGISAALLAVQQIAARRLALPTLLCAGGTLAMLSAAAVVVVRPAAPREARKAYPAPDTGELKAAAAAGVRTSIWRSAPRSGRWEAADRASLVLGSMRSRFVSTGAGGSGIDDDVVFLRARDVAAYLPRAAAIGLWAPFPADWIAPGRSVGTAGRVLAGVEMLAIYFCEGLAIAAVLIPPRRIAATLLLLFAVFAVTAEAVVVANLGALYRFRYAFWLLLVVLGVVGLTKLRARTAAAAAAVLLAASSASCAGTPPTDAMRLTNVTGFEVLAIHLSPRDARTWQENLLGADALQERSSIDVHLPPAAASVTWDLRIDGAGGYRGEWTGLDLSAVSTLTLRVAHGEWVADLEKEP